MQIPFKILRPQRYYHVTFPKQIRFSLSFVVPAECVLKITLGFTALPVKI